MYKSDDQLPIDLEITNMEFNHITLGSHARGENKSTDSQEITIDLERQLVIDLKNGTADPEKIFDLTDLKHPEMILEAWTSNIEEVELLMKAKEFLLSSEQLDRTQSKLTKHFRRALRCYENGIYTYKGNTSPQVVLSSDLEMNFIYNSNYASFGAKFGLLRLVQLGTLICIINSGQNAVNFFLSKNINMQPTIGNRLTLLEYIDVISYEQRIATEKTYYQVSSIYQNQKNNPQVNSLSNFEDILEMVYLMKNLVFNPSNPQSNP